VHQKARALHVLQGFLGQDRLDFWPVLMASEDGGVSAAEPLTRGDAVYLCSPQRNPALGRLAPALALTDDTTPGIPAFDGIDLPCWFADDYRAWEHGGQVPDSPTKKLWICELKTAVSSEAERAYREAAGLAPLSFATIVVRHDEGAPVPGQLVLARKA
ncbi:MAG: hypothetical protein CVT86_05855, partial [Alphaproteobacteria bacterium HGW-Alphaproteobacteria-8]